MDTETNARPTAPPRAWKPVLGPESREHFLDAQQRNRRATWRLTAAAALVMAALGLIASLVLVPAVLFQLRILFGLLGIVLPPAKPLGAAAEWYLTLFIPHTDAPRSQLQLTVGVVAWILPGVIALVASWLGLRRLFRDAGIGGALLTLGAREPRADDLEERQLVNVVEEMAIAAGISPPRVMLLEAELPNAAALGTGPGDATVVVSRRLLDDMDRDETQAVLGHLTGSIGNGDLAVVWTILSVFQTFGLAMVVLNLPVSQTSRESFAHFIRFCAGRRDAPDRAAQGDAITTRLAYELRAEGMDDLVNFMAALERKDIGTARRVVYYARTIVLLPLLLGIVITKFLLGVTMLFLLGWLLARSWHTRRYLADATAVQLTRNPDALARALVTLRGYGGVTPAARQLDYLFIVGGEAARARAEAELQEALANFHQAEEGRPTLREMAGQIGSAARVLAESRRAPQSAVQDIPSDPHGPDAAIRLLSGFERQLADSERGTFADEQGIVASFHPRLDRRLKRLRKLGAAVA